MIEAQADALPKRRGRPTSPDSKTNAERQTAFRKRHVLVDAGGSIPQTIERLAAQYGLTKDQVTRELLRFALCNKNWGRFGFPGVPGG